MSCNRTISQFCTVKLTEYVIIEKNVPCQRGILWTFPCINDKICSHRMTQSGTNILSFLLESNISSQLRFYVSALKLNRSSQLNFYDEDIISLGYILLGTA